MKMKRFIFLAISVFSLVACGNRENYEVAEYDPPTLPYYDNGDIYVSIANELIVLGDEWPIDAMLALPAGATADTPVPAVVIVAGSGSHSMDGTMGELDIYLDVANFLQENGVASIRHNRRFYQYPEAAFEGYTLYEEVMADALKALEVLLDDPRIDSDRIYLVGHSMGGFIAPRIHSLSEDAFNGLVLMAGTPRDMGTLLAEQVGNSIAEQREGIQYLADNFDPEEIYEILQMPLEDVELLVDDFEGLLEDFKRMLSTLAEMPAEEVRGTTMSLGLDAYWVRDQLLHPFSELVVDMDVDILVLQPERDFQVLADVDFVMLQEIFAGRDNAQFKLYPDLNHLFMSSIATNFTEHGAELVALMEMGGNMDAGMLGDIVNWIFNR